MKNDFIHKWKDNTPLLCCSQQLGLRSGNSIKGFLHNCVSPPSSLCLQMLETATIQAKREGGYNAEYSYQ